MSVELVSSARNPGSLVGLRSPAALWRALAGLALFAATLALYVSTRSRSLDDFDSFNFARALSYFDLRLNQPQPPGYPVYVAAARLVDMAVGDQQAALTLLSALSGALAVVAFFTLAADLGAPWAALPLAPMPLFWLSAGMALSDVPGLALTITAVWLLCRGRCSHPHLLAGCALTGLAAGIRPQDAIVPLGVLVLWAAPARLRMASRRGQALRAMAAALGVLVAACLAWAVPLLASSGGPTSALAALLGQSRYVGAVDSMLSRPLTLPNVLARLAEFGSVLGAYFGGPLAGGLPALAGLALATGVLALLAAPAVRRLALIWLLPYGVFMLLAMRPDDPRKLLPTIPPLLLLLAGVRLRPLAATLSVALAMWFGYAAWPYVRILIYQPAPPEQAAAYVRSTFSPTDTLVLAGSSYNAVRYRDPAFKAFLLDDLDPAAVDRLLASGMYRNLVLMDKEGYGIPQNYVGVDSRTFQRNALVLPKAATVWLAVYRPLYALAERDLLLPAGPVHIGTPEDVRYVTDGWYRPEIIAGIPARWSAEEATIRFWVDRPADATLHLAAVAYPATQQLTVLVNARTVAQVSMVTDWAPYTVVVPAGALRANALNVITLRHRLARSAFEQTDGQSLDRRPLAAAYSSFELTWQ